MKLRTASARRSALTVGAAALALGAIAPAALAVAPSSTGTTTVSASVNSLIALTAPTDFSFGALNIGDSTTATGKQVTVVSNISGGYQLSVTRTDFTNGDIPLAISGTSTTGGSSDLPANTPDPVYTAITSSALNLGHRTSTISSSGGDQWTFAFKLGPVPFVQDGPHSSILTFTALGL